MDITKLVIPLTCSINAWCKKKEKYFFVPTLKDLHFIKFAKYFDLKEWMCFWNKKYRHHHQLRREHNDLVKFETMPWSIFLLLCSVAQQILPSRLFPKRVISLVDCDWVVDNRRLVVRFHTVAYFHQYESVGSESKSWWSSILMIWTTQSGFWLSTTRI